MDKGAREKAALSEDSLKIIVFYDPAFPGAPALSEAEAQLIGEVANAEELGERLRNAGAPASYRCTRRIFPSTHGKTSSRT